MPEEVLYVEVSWQMKTWLRAVAEQEGESISAVVRDIIRAAMTRRAILARAAQRREEVRG